MWFAMTARHRSKAIELWQQGDITYAMNAEPDGYAARFGAQHGPCAPAMGWQVVSAQKNI
jgi:4-hydroxyphenylpyruvate dioxygenase